MNYEDILINGLLLFISYKVILGSYEIVKYLFIISILLILYFRGLRSGGFFYRQIRQSENEPDIYIIRPLKELF